MLPQRHNSVKRLSVAFTNALRPQRDHYEMLEFNWLQAWLKRILPNKLLMSILIFDQVFEDDQD